ncbi:MAG: MBL fold metallo-hydrolase [Verrucomicrobia bacterium]|nr:MBL fold metallo-hydrolase [Verrucomicrobiota bacterium]
MLRLVESLTSGGPSGTTFQSRTSQISRDDLGLEPKVREAAPDRPVRVKFWGVRGSIPTPGPATAYYGGNTSCIEVEADGEHIILDAGTGIRPLGLEWAARYPDRAFDITVLITHTHWDHIQGFPFFVPAYDPRNRIRILGYEGARRGLEQTLASQMESPYFPISMQEMPGNIAIQEQKDLEFNVGNVRVQAQFMNHPGICVGYRLFTSAGSIAFLPDNELFTRLKSQSGIMTEKEAETQIEYARGQDRKLIEFLRDVDVLILDAQYDEQEYLKHVGWGHSCVDDAVAVAHAAGARQLFLFHHDPGHDDTKIAQMAAHGRQLASNLEGKLKVEAAREGVEILLRASKPAVKPAAAVAAAA